MIAFECQLALRTKSCRVQPCSFALQATHSNAMQQDARQAGLHLNESVTTPGKAVFIFESRCSHGRPGAACRLIARSPSMIAPLEVDQM